MKYISFVVPCFNSEKYMEKCIDSLLMCGDDVEIIIVNDGSTDKTAEIAKNYLKNNSNIKFIDKENGGHGSGINAGLKYVKAYILNVLILMIGLILMPIKN